MLSTWGRFLLAAATDGLALWVTLGEHPFFILYSTILSIKRETSEIPNV